MSCLYHFPSPTIAVVQGAAFGGGVGLVSCCDIAIASDKASFCLSEVKLGLVQQLTSADNLEQVADSLITTLLQNSPQALKACKKLIQDVDGAINSPLRDMTTTLIAELRASPEGKEGLSAFLEKRPAGWLQHD